MNRRVIIKLCVFLFLGAVVNVAVAWGLSWRIPSYVAFTTADDLVEIDVIKRLEVGWFVHKSEGFGGTQISSMWLRDRIDRIEVEGKLHPLEILPSGFDLEHPAAEFENDTSRFSDRHVFFRGWPLRSFAYAIDGPTADGNLVIKDGFLVGALSATMSSGNTVRYVDGRRMLPFRPIWPGFAINTFFYAAILWLVFAAPFTLRRWRRIRRGLCVKCAYPVGASDVCTECGAHINKKIKARGSMGLPPPATPPTKSEPST